jgi:hypothetical protein
MSCPCCDEEDIYQVADHEDASIMYWCLRGYADPYPSPGRPYMCIDFCPFCGEDLYNPEDAEKPN